MRKPYLYVSLGLLFNIVGLILNKFYPLNNFISGSCAAIGLTLIFFGIIFQEYDVIRFFNKKNTNK
ncbi:hypothetical protein [Terrisporobacter sp.]